MNNSQKAEDTSHVRKLFSHTIIYGAGIFMNRAVSLILLPVYTYFFSPAELGLFNLIQSVWLFVILIYLYGLETSFMKFFIDAENREHKSEVYSTVLILVTITSVFFSIATFFLSGPIVYVLKFDDFIKSRFLMQILAFVLFFDTLFRFPLLLLRAELNAKKYFHLNILSLVTNILFNLFFIIVLRLNVESIFYSYIISVFVTFVAGLIVTKGYIKPLFSFSKAKELAIYGNKFIYIGLFILFIDISDRFFLKYFFDESTVGIYSACYRLASVMGLIISAFKFSWTPYFLNLANDENNKKIISDIFTYYVFAGMFLFLFLTFLTEPIVKIQIAGFNLLDIKYHSGLPIVPIIILAYFFSGLFANLNVAPFFKDKTIYLLWTALIGFAVNILLNIILIPKYKMSGAAYSTLVTYFIMFIVIFFISQRIYRIEYQIRKIQKIIILTLISFLGFEIIKFYLISNYYIQILLGIILLSGYIIFASVMKVVNIREIVKVIKQQT